MAQNPHIQSIESEAVDSIQIILAVELSCLNKIDIRKYSQLSEVPMFLPVGLQSLS